MKLASYVGTRDSIMGLGNRLIRLRLSGIRQALQTDNTSIQDTLRASHSEIVFEPGDNVDHLMPDGTCQPNEKGELWCVSSIGLERIPSFSRRRAGKMGGVRFKRINVNSSVWELDDSCASPQSAAETHRIAMEASPNPESYDFNTGWPLSIEDWSCRKFI